LAAFMILVIVEKERHSQSHHIADKKRDLIFSYKLWKTYAVHKRLFTFQWPCLGGLVLYMFIFFSPFRSTGIGPSGRPGHLVISFNCRCGRTKTRLGVVGSFCIV